MSDARRAAIEEQERLFPGKFRDDLWWVPSLTLADITLQLRAACNGSADPWEPAFLRDVVAMLRARLVTWHENGWGDGDDLAIDDAVRAMVRAAVCIGDATLAVDEALARRLAETVEREGT